MKIKSSYLSGRKISGTKIQKRATLHKVVLFVCYEYSVAAGADAYPSCVILSVYSLVGVGAPDDPPRKHFGRASHGVSS